MSGRLTDTDLEYLLRLAGRGRLTDTDIEFVLQDEAPKQIRMGPGGWGFIPIGRRVDRSVYIDTYEDEY